MIVTIVPYVLVSDREIEILSPEGTLQHGIGVILYRVHGNTKRLSYNTLTPREKVNIKKFIQSYTQTLMPFFCQDKYCMGYKEENLLPLGHNHADQRLSN